LESKKEEEKEIERCENKYEQTRQPTARQSNYAQEQAMNVGEEGEDESDKAAMKWQLY